jgi:hypothetical protein
LGTLAYSRLQFVVDEPIVAAARVASPVTNDARASAVRVARRRDADMIDRSIRQSVSIGSVSWFDRLTSVWEGKKVSGFETARERVCLFVCSIGVCVCAALEMRMHEVMKTK